MRAFTIILSGSPKHSVWPQASFSAPRRVGAFQLLHAQPAGMEEADSCQISRLHPPLLEQLKGSTIDSPLLEKD